MLQVFLGYTKFKVIMFYSTTCVYAHLYVPFLTSVTHIFCTTHLFSFQKVPHVYSVADRAYQNLQKSFGDSRVNQCIIVSGESGAGKVSTAMNALL